MTDPTETPTILQSRQTLRGVDGKSASSVKDALRHIGARRSRITANRGCVVGRDCAAVGTGGFPMHKSRILIVAALVGGLMALPAIVDAQDRAVPRGSAPSGGRPSGGGRGHREGAVGRQPGRAIRQPPGGPVARPGPNRYRGYEYRPYRSGYYYGGYPGFWYAYPYGRSFDFGYGYGYPGYGYAEFGYPGYGYSGYPGYVRAYGGVRIAVPQRDAEVYVDGYYAGVVDDFDGGLQQVNLEPGPHQLEVRAEGFEPVTFDVNVEPGRTITYRIALRQSRP